MSKHLGFSVYGIFTFMPAKHVRGDTKVTFSKTSIDLSLPDQYMESERQMKEMKWKEEKMLEDMRREQVLLDTLKLNFEKKKAEFVQFLAEAAARVSTNPTNKHDINYEKWPLHLTLICNILASVF